MMSRRIFLVFPTVLILAACSAVPPPGHGALRPDKALFSAAHAIQDQWRHVPMRGTTDYRIAVKDGRVAIQAIGRNSASALMRRVSVDPSRCPVIEWSWYVARIQKNADIRIKDREDVAASIFLLFGDPGFLSNPQPVPTLRYVWTNGTVPVETVVDNPYLQGVVRSIVVESGTDRMGRWVTERRDVLADFRRAFGREPSEGIHVIALFTDNDQTEEPVEAYYGRAHMECVP